MSLLSRLRSTLHRVLSRALGALSFIGIPADAETVDATVEFVVARGGGGASPGNVRPRQTTSGGARATLPNKALTIV
jgi:hypothetical protein